MLVNADTAFEDIMERAGTKMLSETGRYRLVVIRTPYASPNAIQALKIFSERMIYWFSSEWIYQTPHSVAILFQDISGWMEKLETLKQYLSAAGCLACYSPVFTALLQAKNGINAF